MKNVAWILAVTGLASAAALAHTGVRNPAVLARMQAMTAMADQMEVIVPMARGEATFDAARAEAAFAELARLAEETPGLFRAPEQDPRSEALPAIWEDFAEFEARSREMADRAAAAADSVADPAGLLAAVRRLGASCSGCHERYRLED